jgi:hypothetical protein
MGLVIGPLALTFLVTVVELYRRELQTAEPDPAPSPPGPAGAERTALPAPAAGQAQPPAGNGGAAPGQAG